MSTRVKSINAFNLFGSSAQESSEKRLRNTTKIPFFSRTSRMSAVSVTWSSIDSDDDEDKQAKRLKQFETRRHLTKTISKTYYCSRRVANWSYEREWRKERKTGFDPVYWNNIFRIYSLNLFCQE